MEQNSPQKGARNIYQSARGIQIPPSPPLWFGALLAVPVSHNGLVVRPHSIHIGLQKFSAGQPPSLNVRHPGASQIGHGGSPLAPLLVR